jgi:lysophospholipase L1-like esterase
VGRDGATAGTGGATAGAGGVTVGSGGAAGASGGRGGATAGSGGRGGATAGAGGGGGSAGAGGRGGASGTAGASGSGGRGGAGGTSVTDAGADGNGDGSTAFNPCPGAGTACIIMPLGDSITYGVGSPDPGGGYRVPLFQQTITSAELITFAGRNTNGPTTVGGRTFPQHHEGYSGYTIDPGGGRMGISPLVDGAISMFHPHIVLLQIGTNDVNISLDLANAPTRLGALMDRITTDAPNALLVVARITPTKTDTTNGRVQTYNDAIPGLVQSRVAAGKHIVVVDMYAAFTANANYQNALMYDELHPNAAGYMVMAQTWYAAISRYLPGN